MLAILAQHQVIRSRRAWVPGIHGGSRYWCLAHTFAARCHVYLGYPDRALALSEADTADLKGAKARLKSCPEELVE